jgi:aspartate-semialdehyde dehydrogenase
MVAVNRTKVTGAPIPFGGMKQSGLAREGARHGLEAFTDIKYVCRDWGPSPASSQPLGYPPLP